MENDQPWMKRRERAAKVMKMFNFLSLILSKFFQLTASKLNLVAARTTRLWPKDQTLKDVELSTKRIAQHPTSSVVQTKLVQVKISKTI